MPGGPFPPVGPLGRRFPTFPTRNSSLPAIGTMIRYDCQKPVSGSFGSPSPHPIPCIARLSLCPFFSTQARVRGSSLLSTPGVFTSTDGTPKPDCTQGDHWLSQVPRLPPCIHALVLDPGGVLHTRPLASRTAAFRPMETVGFLPTSGIILQTTTLHISGLNTGPACLIRPASDSHLWAYPRTSLLTCWLDFSQVGLESYRPSPTG